MTDEQLKNRVQAESSGVLSPQTTDNSPLSGLASVERQFLKSWQPFRQVKPQLLECSNHKSFLTAQPKNFLRLFGPKHSLVVVVAPWQ